MKHATQSIMDKIPFSQDHGYQIEDRC